MHSVIVDAIVCALLLSSLIALAVLLRGGCKRKKQSPLHILSTSDVFSTILTAIALLMNHAEAAIKLNYNWQNGTTDDMPNRTWTIKDDQGKHQFLPRRIRDHKVTDEMDPDMILTCDTKDIFMQYGLLLVPLTNAFVSLLTFAVQCNLDAACVKRRCTDVITVNDIPPESRYAEVTRRKEEQGSTSKQQDTDTDIDASNTNDIVEKTMKISRFQLSRVDKKPASFLVVSHWLLPFLVVTILYLAAYNDANIIRNGSENTECILESNFPVNNFYVLSDTKDNVKFVDSDKHTAPLENDYSVSEDFEKLSNKSDPSGTEVERIISKIQNIVKYVLDYGQNSTEDVGTADVPNGLQNVTGYDGAININHTENNTNTNDIIQRIDNLTIEQIAIIRNQNLNAGNNTHFDRDQNASLFYPLNADSEELDTVTSNSVMQTSAQHNYEKYAEIHLANTTRGTTDISVVQDTMPISDHQIYADIIKRIQAASTYAVNNRYNRSTIRYRDRKQSKWNNLIDHAVREIKPTSIEDLFFNKNKNLNRDTDTTNESLSMINECLVSTKFLKLHLLILSFTIYFLPILLCCILQVRGKYMCENALAILKGKADLISDLLRGKINENKNENATVINESRKKWFPTSSTEICHEDSIEKFDTSQKIKESDATDIEAVNKNYKCYLETQNKNILFEVDCTIKIFKVIKMSLILCTILWTPVFLATLLKVFSCIRAPQWLTDIMFSSAISFGIVRNILNLNVVKIQELCSNDSVKENRIHPSK